MLFSMHKKYYDYLWGEYFFREMLLLNGAANKVKIYKNKKDKLPFAVFIIFDNKNTDVAVDYKEIFTDIISDRIKQ